MVDIKEMIAECEKNLKENEAVVFAMGSGRMLPMIGKAKAQKRTFEYIKKLDGFIGVTPVDLWHTLLLFDTLNNAKKAHNLLNAKGVPLGGIAPIVVEKKYLEK